MRTLTDDVRDLIEEAKVRTVWWIICIFAVTYFLTHTSKSMLMNAPIAILLVSGLRLLFYEVDFHWKVRRIRPTSYLSHLEKKQLSVDDSRLLTLLPPRKWKRKIESPAVEAAINDFVNKLLQDFILDLWYSDITADKEAPELIHAIIMDVLGEVSGRIKEVNLVDLLTRDIVDKIGDHIELFRRNQAAIGKDVMSTLSSKERDERLKHHLVASKELHPALISPECEYKVIQQLMSGLLSVVLRPSEAECPLVRCIARELLTCLVMQPLMSFASPGYINEMIEYFILAYGKDLFKFFATPQSQDTEGNYQNHSVFEEPGLGNQGTDESLSLFDVYKEQDLGASEDLLCSSPQPGWAKGFEAASLRRTEVLTPENLENMWTIGRNYKKKLQKKSLPELQVPGITRSLSLASPRRKLLTEVKKQKSEASIKIEDKDSKQSTPRSQQDTQPNDLSTLKSSEGLSKNALPNREASSHELENIVNVVPSENLNDVKTSNTTSVLEAPSNLEHIITSGSPVTPQYYSADVDKLNKQRLKNISDRTPHSEVLHVPKLRSRVVGAYFEKIGSNSIAVYSIAVTDAENATWFVKRRYRNFERLHRHLKDIPNYTLQLPPKKIFSSSTEDALVQQRCIQLDKYLQDLLSIANVVEQHEVWDFLSASSENYSFERSSSVMSTLAVNVDGAVDDIVRQFKGVSNGLRRIVAGSPSYSTVTSRNISLNADDINKLAMRQATLDSVNSSSDYEECEKDVSRIQQEPEFSSQVNECHSDNELKEDLSDVPPEWTPPNFTVPVLNLVDKVFQLKKRGWLRRQVFWMSKQILHLLMEDAIDDWLLRQIQWLRQEDVVVQGIRWLQEVLFPGGTFFLSLRLQGKLSNNQTNGQEGGKRSTQPGSFEQQLEAVRRASDVKKMILNGAPTALVSFIGHKQYTRCASDIYYFLQSTVCLKQIGYEMLELVLISIFPELRDVVRNMHEKMQKEAA